jgi:hypothetical protein
MLKIRAEYDINTSPSKLMDIYRQVFSPLLLDVSAGIW